MIVSLRLSFRRGSWELLERNKLALRFQSLAGDSGFDSGSGGIGGSVCAREAVPFCGPFGVEGSGEFVCEIRRELDRDGGRLTDAVRPLLPNRPAADGGAEDPWLPTLGFDSFWGDFLAVLPPLVMWCCCADSTDCVLPILEPKDARLTHARPRSQLSQADGRRAKRTGDWVERRTGREMSSRQENITTRALLLPCRTDIS